MKLIVTSQTSFLQRDGQRKFDKNKNKPLQTTYGFTADTQKVLDRGQFLLQPF